MSVQSLCRIIGHVYDTKGMRLRGVRVICDGKETFTLFDGTYEFNDVKPGTYTISVTLKGFKSDSKTITLKEGETVVTNFQLSEAVGNAKIHGSVYDAETNKPITGGTVTLIMPISNRYASLNKNGYYEFKNLVGDTYELSVSIPGYKDEKAIVKVNDGEEKIQNFYCKPVRIIEPCWG
ncbi:MAG: carboxypeptidase-like regulatory domain-containing protein [Nitrososphaerales archaeon]